MKTFANIVKTLKALVGARSEKELAEMLGINYRTFATEKRRNSIPYEVIIDFCTRKGIELEAVFFQKREKKLSEEPIFSAPPSARMLAVFDNIPSLFPEKAKEESVTQYIALPDETQGSFVFNVKDESMIPILKPGDYVVFRYTRTFSNRDLVVLNDRWNETHIRRYREGDGQILLTPDNPEYPELSTGPDTHLIGVVSAAWRRLKIL